MVITYNESEGFFLWPRSLRSEMYLEQGEWHSEDEYDEAIDISKELAQIILGDDEFDAIIDNLEYKQISDSDDWLNSFTPDWNDIVQYVPNAYLPGPKDDSDQIKQLKEKVKELTEELSKFKTIKHVEVTCSKTSRDKISTDDMLKSTI